MEAVNKKCAKLMKWFIENKKEAITEDEYAKICGELRGEVLQELRNRNIGYRTTKALHSIKVEDAEYWYRFYSNL